MTVKKIKLQIEKIKTEEYDGVNGKRLKELDLEDLETYIDELVDNLHDQLQVLHVSLDD